MLLRSVQSVFVSEGNNTYYAQPSQLSNVDAVTGNTIDNLIREITAA